MAPCPSRAVIFDGATAAASNQRRASAPTTTTATIKGHTNVATAGNGCPTGNCHGCNCGCPTCACRTKPVQDESNREAYGRQGGRPIPGPRPDLRDYLSPHSSSIDTDGTCGINGESFNNSWEVHDCLNAQLTAENLARHDVQADGTRQEYVSSVLDDDENEHPWHNFVDRIDGLRHMAPMAEDSSGMILPGNMDDSSIFPEGGGPNSGYASMLSSWEASFSRQSVSPSLILTGTGTAFGN